MRHLALFAFALVGLPAAALTHVDPFRAEVTVAESGQDADEQVRVEGMKTVIVKASGSRDAISNPLVQKALKQSQDYLEQIGTESKNGTTSVNMAFSEAEIRSLLVQAQIPIWPTERSSILIWLVEEGTERSIVWEHSNSPVLNAIQKAANGRGLPVTFPIGDFADVTGVTANDLWGGFAKTVGKASERYPVDAVVVIKREGNALRWTLYDHKPAEIGVQRQDIVSGSTSGSDFVSDMVNEVSDYFASKNAVKVDSQSASAVKARFSALNDPVTLFMLESKIRQLSSVASVDVLNLQSTQVVLNIHLLSSEQEFVQELLRTVPVTQLKEPRITAEAAIESEAVIETPLDTTSNAASTIGTPEVVIPAIEQVTDSMLQFEWQTPPQVDEPESPASAEETETTAELSEMLEEV